MKFSFAICFLLLGISQAACSDSRKVLEQSVGLVILSYDSHWRYDHDDLNPFGVANAFKIFEIEYEQNIKSLESVARVDYFWAILFHLELQGGYLSEFLDIVAKDSAVSLFIDKLDRFIAIESKLQHDLSSLNLAKSAQGSLIAMLSN